jgi:hypothetical protein
VPSNDAKIICVVNQVNFICIKKYLTRVTSCKKWSLNNKLRVLKYYINGQAELGQSAINIYNNICNIHDNNEVSYAPVSWLMHKLKNG